MNYIHNKTGDIYTVEDFLVIDATNGQEDRGFLVLYRNNKGMKFVRNKTEFHEKFTREL